VTKISHKVQSGLWFTAKLIVGLAIVATIVYWAKFAPVEVTTVSVQQSKVVAEVMGTGTLEARITTSISPKISGRIVKVEVDQGDRVAAGDLLVRLDDEELAQQTEIARANLAARRAAIQRLNSDRQRTVAIQTQASKEFERLSRLAPTKAVSVSALDKAREALAIAQAGLAHSEAAMAEAQEELVAAAKTLEYQQTLLANTRVIAPFDGLIVARIREPGDVVVPGSSILTLISTEELWINAWVDETEMSRLADGQPARVLYRSESERCFRGRVARLGRQADRETREFVVDVSVLELPDNWAVGQRADVFIEVARRDSTLIIPPKAIVWRNENIETSATRVAGVFVDDGGHASWRPVKIGLRSRKSVEILDGLSRSDSVIVLTGKQKSLADGARITIQ